MASVHDDDDDEQGEDGAGDGGSGPRLTGKQRRFLRAQGHHLQPVVLLGKEGVSDAVIAQVNDALATHELIKIRVGQNTPSDRHDVAADLSERTSSALVQVLGNVILLYRAHPDEPKIALPKA